MILEIPIHPFMVHFPIALIIFSFAAFLAYLILGKEVFKEIGFWSLIVGTLGAAIAVVSGMMAEEELKNVSHEMHEHIEKHELLGFITLGLSLLLSAWVFIRKDKMSRSELIIFTFTMLGVVAAIVMTGHEGGELVYEFGAGVEK